MSNILWFSLFLAVPILVHLFNFRRAKQYLFTNVRFIQKVSTETKSKTRLKHILILTSRLLAFVFLLATFLAFQSPSAKTSLGEVISSSTSIYFDNSVSVMEDSEAGIIQSLEQLVASNRANEAFFLTNDFSAFSNHPRSKQEILDELGTLGPSFVNRSSKEILDRMEDTENIFLFSDFQTFGIGELETIKADTNTNYHLIFKETFQRQNVFVDSVWLEKNVDDYTSNNLRCILGTTSQSGSGNVIIQLVDDRGSQISSVVKDLANESNVTFSIPNQATTSYYRILLSGDQLEYDNEFFIVLNSAENPSILVLSETPNVYLEQIFSNEELFTLVKSINGQVDYESIQHTDLVVLNGYYRVPEGLIRQNDKELSFLVIPSDSIDVNSYSDELSLQIRYENETGSRQIELTSDNKFLEGVFEDNRTYTALPTVRSTFKITSIHEQVLRVRGASTFLGKVIEKPVYFFTAPLEDSYTDLPNHAIFLPLMYRIAERSVDSKIDLFANPGDFLEVPELILDSPPRIVSEGFEVIPEFFQQGKNSILKVPVESSPGFYTILQGEDTLKSFGVNLPKSESVFDGLSYDEISAFFQDSDHVIITSNDSQDIQQVLSASSVEGGIWKYALILALVFIVVETMLHRYLK